MSLKVRTVNFRAHFVSFLPVIYLRPTHSIEVLITYGENV